MRISFRNHHHTAKLHSIAMPLVAVAMLCTFFTAMANAKNPDDERKQYWQKRYSMLFAREAAAHARIETAQQVIRKARQRERNQGPARVEAYGELNSAQKELEATRKLIADFPEAARQAGVPPGWLREVEEQKTNES